MALTFIALSGSLRRASFNSSLLRAATGLMPPDAVLQVETIAGIPLYNGDDEERGGIPPAVTRLKDLIAAADGLVLASPEYNNSVPGVAKNAIDWLSRPNPDAARVFGGKPVALMGASPGGFGTVMGQSAWLPVFKTLGARVWSEGRLMVSRAHTAFDAEGRLTDTVVADNLRQFLAGFVTSVQGRG